MIREEYVNFETAKLLKQAGFPQFPLEPDGTQRGVPCTKCYTKDGLLTDWIFQRGDKKACSAPSQAVAMRWLREEKHMLILIVLGVAPGYAYMVAYMRNGIPTPNDEGSTVGVDFDYLFGSYEAAAEAGIQAACEYLIEEGGER